jgi:hypothetical protein
MEMGGEDMDMGGPPVDIDFPAGPEDEFANEPGSLEDFTNMQ